MDGEKIQRADLPEGENDDSTPLHAASSNGHLEVVKDLIGQGADINRASNDNWTPLHAASFNGHLDVVQFLTGQGAVLNRADNDGRTPLYAASFNGHLDVVEFLIGQGADFKRADKDGRTPLYAASFEGHLDVVQFLIGQGSDLNRVDKDGRTPLHAASANGHLDVVQFFIGKGADLQRADKDGWTPLFMAAANGHLDVVQFFIGKGADLKRADKDGWTPLYTASCNGHLDVVQLLIRKGADLNGNDLSTLLEAASLKGHLNVVQFLIGQKADFARAGIGGLTPLEAASFNGHLNVVQFLIGENADLNRPDPAVGSQQESGSVEKQVDSEANVHTSKTEQLNIDSASSKQVVEDVIHDSTGASDEQAGLLRIEKYGIEVQFHPSSDSFVLIAASNGDPRCDVRERDLDLYISHFSEWWIVAFITKVFVGKRVVCTPFVPEPSPMNTKHLVRLCIRDSNQGKAEPEPGYVTPIKGEEYFVAWRSGDLKVTCQVDDKDIYTKTQQETLFHKSVEVNVRFIVNTPAADQSKVFVQFILEQSAKMEIICPMNLSGKC
eukprot:XP_011661332.1 PREDICTED: ankyrin repeat domain-containing protein 50-like [Strongylocentrotus purpuratus]